MKKNYLFILALLVILLTSCTTEQPPTMETSFLDTGLFIDGESILYKKQVRSDIGLLCEETYELVAIYSIEATHYLVEAFQVDDSECYSNYYIYHDAGEGYDNLSSVYSSGEITLEQLQSVLWEPFIYETNNQYGDNTIEDVLKEYLVKDVVELLTWAMDYCVSNACVDNQEFTISDFPLLNDEFLVEYDFTANDGVILIRENTNDFLVYMEPTGTGQYEFLQGVTTSIQEIHLGNYTLVLDQD